MDPKKNLNKIKYLPMVNWYNIKQLIHTASKVIFSKIIGEQSDKRIIQALASKKKEYFDYNYYYHERGDKCYVDIKSPRKEIWIDYIADTGDGWNSTYAVAYYASNPELDLKYENQTYKTKRGEVSLFGGDEVYPTPSKLNYSKRLTVPFEIAFGEDNPKYHPHLFAIPGNHDWYDGLSAFSRIFCSDLNRKFAGWLTRQRRSYFALKLPGNWWLLGSDGQLHSDIDTPQIEYFRYITEKYMKHSDRVLLCISQPNWIYADKYKKYGQPYDESDLLYLQNEIFLKKNIEIKIFLSGDLHHYQRHEEENAKDKQAKVQKIIAGGGGAFLHPTHGFNASKITEDNPAIQKTERKFILKKSFPEIKDSKRLTFQNLFFIFKNPWFGILTGIFYLLTAWMIGALVINNNPTNFSNTFTLTENAFRNSPFVAIWVVMVMGIFIIFTDTHSKLFKWLGGLSHCLAHFFCIFLIIYFSTKIFGGKIFLEFYLVATLTFVLGWIIGSFIMGFYLFISNYIFGRHDEEAFSALKIQDYKNFLRMHIAENGDLTIYPIKIHKVPRKWEKKSIRDTDKIKSYIVPMDGSGAELIEDPIILKATSAFIST